MTSYFVILERNIIDIMVLLVPCASAMRMMLQIYCSFSVSHKLTFNGTKTQLMFLFSISPSDHSSHLFHDIIHMQCCTAMIQNQNKNQK